MPGGVPDVVAGARLDAIRPARRTQCDRVRNRRARERPGRGAMHLERARRAREARLGGGVARVLPQVQVLGDGDGGGDPDHGDDEPELETRQGVVPVGGSAGGHGAVSIGRVPRAGDTRMRDAEPGQPGGTHIAPQTKSATIEPRARKGPNGKPIFRPARPWRTRMAMDGTSEARLAITRAAATLVPSAAPIRNASLTSPIPIPCGEIRLKTSRKPDAAQAQISHTGLGWAMVIAASTTSDAGPTTRFGINRY